jgi:hypothetical protein
MVAPDETGVIFSTTAVGTDKPAGDKRRNSRPNPLGIRRIRDENETK